MMYLTGIQYLKRILQKRRRKPSQNEWETRKLRPEEHQHGTSINTGRAPASQHVTRSSIPSYKVQFAIGTITHPKIVRNMMSKSGRFGKFRLSRRRTRLARRSVPRNSVVPLARELRVLAVPCRARKSAILETTKTNGSPNRSPER